MPAAVMLRPSRWQRSSWAHPEWWSLGLCVAAWLLMLWRVGPSPAGPHASHAHAGHAAATGAPTDWQGDIAAGSLWWLVMVVAMMFPMLLAPIRTTAARSLWRRRHRAIGGFLLGYLIPWMLFGVAACAAAAALQTHLRPEPWALPAAGFCAALLWQATPVKRRAVSACHRTRPLAPAGWRADADCLRYGWAVGHSCVVSCWALMLACLLAGHGIHAMVGATVVGWAERRQRRPSQRLLGALIAALAVASVAQS